MWRSRERTKALKRFGQELDRARAQLDRDMAFVYEATVFEDATAVWADPPARLPGAPTPAMIELRAAAEEVVREMAYLFERDAQDDATLAANDIKDALAYRRLRAALTAQELPTEEQPTRQPEP